MTNQGLKHYTKQISGSIGRINYYVNPSKYSANLIFDIPIVNKKANKLVGLSLLYNHQYRNIDDKFGLGYKCNYDMSIIENTTSIIYKALDSVEYYFYEISSNTNTSYVEYKNQELGYYIRKYNELIDDEYKYQLIDKNHTSYLFNGVGYLGKIVLVNEDNIIITNNEISLDFSKIRYTITNNKVTNINNIVNGIYYIDKIDLVYSNNKLTNITIYHDTKIVEKYQITYLDNYITIFDSIKLYGVKFYLTSNRVTKIEEQFYQTIGNTNTLVDTRVISQIEYNDYLSRVTDIYGDVLTYAYDDKDIVSYSYDEKKNVLIESYDILNRLSYKSDVIKLANVNKKIGIYIPKSNLNTTLSAVSDSSGEGLKLGFLKKRRLSSNMDGLIGNVIYEATYAGKKNECITILTFITANNVSYDTTMYIDAMLYNDAELIDHTRFDITSNKNHIVALGLNGYKEFNCIRIIINVMNTNLEFSEFVILNEGYGRYYTYDINNNVTRVKSSETIINYSFDNNKLSSIKDTNKEIVLKYDDNLNPNVILDSYDNKIINEYIGRKLVNEKTESLYGKNELKYTYNDVELVSMVEDDEDKYYYEYDDYGRLKYCGEEERLETSYPKQYYEYTYTANNLSNQRCRYLDENRLTTTLGEISYTYDSKDNLKSITTPNGSIYTFNYDNHNRLVSVYLDNKLLESYTYDSYDRITKKSYSSSNYHQFEYQNNLLKVIKYLNSNRYTFEYNDDELLSSVINHELNETINYSYDEEKKITLISDGENSVGYDYHKDNNDVSIKRDIKGFVIKESVNNNIGKIVLSNDRLIGLFNENNKYVGTFFTNDGVLRSNYEGINYEVKTNREYFEIVKEDDLYCYKLSIDENPYLGLSNETSESKEDNPTKGEIGFWFKANMQKSSGEASRNVIIFEYSADSSIGILTDLNNNLKLYYELNGSEKVILEEFTNIENEAWHFVSLSWEAKIEDVNGLRYSFMLDGIFKEGNIELEEELSITTSIYQIGYYSGIGLGSNYYLYITGLITSISGYLSNEEVRKYYELSKLYLFDDLEEKIDVNTKIEYSDLEGYKIYPLHGSFNSLDNEKPIYEDLRYPITDKRLSFNYNKEVKRYVFDALCGKLNYSFGNSNKFTIGMRVYPYDVEALQYLFSGIDSDGNGISLYIDTDNYVKIKHNEGVINTLKTLNKNVWSTVILTYDLSINKSDNIIMSINGNLYRTNKNQMSLNLQNTIIGSDYNYQNPFNGQMEMIITKNDYINISSIYSLSSQFSVRSITNGYDSLGRISFKNIKATANILNTEYTYKEITDTDNNKVPLPKVDKEVITTNSLNVERSYSYGSSINKNNITTITDSVFGNKQYTYDNRGFLVYDNGNIITYDTNGNIKKYGTKAFTYDSTIKDRLINCGGKAITYSSSNPLLPQSYNNMTFSYEGKRLSSITINYDSETTIYCDYYYNHEGLRIKKNVSYEYTDDRDSYSVTTYYYYEGNRLITEYRSDTDRIDYLYDSNGLLYGFINNKTERFYYVRDILQNILGIIDSNGNLVVKYDCNAYGVILSVTGSNTTIGHRNPFRYKGYYYDSETGLFMVGHRYYNPEWGRWIQPDDIEYLDPTNINGLNLYAYCNNDPVNMYDPDGHFSLPNWAKWVIGGVAFAGAVALTIVSGGSLAPVFIGMGVSIASSALIEGAISYANGEGFWNGVADGAADGAMWGGIFALAGATIGAIKYGLSAKGAVKGTQHFTTITKGQQFDRYGRLTGKYITDIGTSASKLALPATNTGIKTSLQATRNFRVITGVVADAFGGTGGGTQYVMRYSIEKLLNMGWLVII